MRRDCSLHGARRGLDSQMSPAAPRGGDTTGLAIRRAAAASGYGIRPFGRIVAGAIPGGLQRWKGSCQGKFLGLFDSSSQLGGARLSPGTEPPFSPNSSRRPSSARTGLRDLKATSSRPSVAHEGDRGRIPHDGNSTAKDGNVAR